MLLVISEDHTGFMRHSFANIRSLLSIIHTSHSPSELLVVISLDAEGGVGISVFFLTMVWDWSRPCLLDSITQIPPPIHQYVLTLSTLSPFLYSVGCDRDVSSLHTCLQSLLSHFLLP